MKTIKTLQAAMIAFAVMLASSTAWAGQATDAQVYELLDAMKVTEAADMQQESMLKVLMPKLRNEILADSKASKEQDEEMMGIIEEEMRIMLNTAKTDVMALMVKLYRKALSAEDVRETIKFYKSEAGQRLLGIQQQVMMNYGQIYQALLLKHRDPMEKRLVQRFQQLEDRYKKQSQH